MSLKAVFVPRKTIIFICKTLKYFYHSLIYSYFISMEVLKQNEMHVNCPVTSIHSSLLVPLQYSFFPTFLYVLTASSWLWEKFLRTKLLIQGNVQSNVELIHAHLSSSLLSHHSNMFKSFCFIYPVFCGMECSVESYREQAIQLPGIARRVVVPAKA